MKEFRRAAFSGAGGNAPSGEDLLQSGILSAKVAQVVEIAHLKIELTGEFAAVLLQFSLAGVLFFQIFQLLANRFNGRFQSGVDFCKYYWINHWRYPSRNQPVTVVLTGKGAKKTLLSLIVYIFKQAEHLASRLAEEKLCRAGAIPLGRGREKVYAFCLKNALKQAFCLFRCIAGRETVVPVASLAPASCCG